MFKEISPTGNIVYGDSPVNYHVSELKNIAHRALNLGPYSFQWYQKSSQPYHGVLKKGKTKIDLYIYIWNITPAQRANPSEKRIQIRSGVNDIGFNRPISNDAKTILIGLYNSPTGTPLFTAWDTTPNIEHKQKSCYVQIEDVAKAMLFGIYKTQDKNGYPIYTMTPDFLPRYVYLLRSGNSLDIPHNNDLLYKKILAALEE